jgi:hypothetical protein
MPFVKKKDVKGAQPPTDARKIFVGRTSELQFFITPRRKTPCFSTGDMRRVPCLGLGKEGRKVGLLTVESLMLDTVSMSKRAYKSNRNVYCSCKYHIVWCVSSKAAHRGCYGRSFRC